MLVTIYAHGKGDNNGWDFVEFLFAPTVEQCHLSAHVCQYSRCIISAFFKKTKLTLIVITVPKS